MTNGSFQTCWVVELLSILMKIPWFVSVFLDFHHEGNKFVFETYHEKTQKQICYMVDTTLEYLQRFLKTRHEQHFKLKLVSLTAGSEFTKHQEINRSNGISDLIGGVQNIVCYIYSNSLICAHVLWISFLLNAWEIDIHSETVSASSRAFWNATSGYVWTFSIGDKKNYPWSFSKIVWTTEPQQVNETLWPTVLFRRVGWLSYYQF